MRVSRRVNAVLSERLETLLPASVRECATSSGAKHDFLEADEGGCRGTEIMQR